MKLHDRGASSKAVKCERRTSEVRTVPLMLSPWQGRKTGLDRARRLMGCQPTAARGFDSPPPASRVVEVFAGAALLHRPSEEAA